jgi:hypothetical protein
VSRFAGAGNRRGQSLAEFALALPIFILLLTSAFDIGRFVIAQTALTNAAREGVRLAVVNQTQTEIEGRVQQMAFLTSPTLQVPLYLARPPAVNDTNLGDNAQCAPITQNCIAVIRLSADLSPITPIVSSILGPITLTSTAMQPVEFVCPNPAIPGFTTPDSCPKQAS